MKMNKRPTARCVWGSKSDISIQLNGATFSFDSNGAIGHTVDKGQLGLTIEQAKDLIKDLSIAISNVEYIEELSGIKSSNISTNPNKHDESKGISFFGLPQKSFIKNQKKQGFSESGRVLKESSRP